MGIREAILNEVKEQGFEQGFKEGFEQGFKKGLEQVRKELTKEGIKKMLQKGKFSLQEIAEILDVDIDFVKQVKNDLDLA